MYAWKCIFISTKWYAWKCIFSNHSFRRNVACSGNSYNRISFSLRKLIPFIRLESIEIDTGIVFHWKYPCRAILMPLCTRELTSACGVLSAMWFLSRNFGGLCCNRRRRPVSGTERSRSGVSSLGRLLSTRRPSLIRRQTSYPALPANMSTLRTREIIRTWKPMVTVDPNCFASLSEWKPGTPDRVLNWPRSTTLKPHPMTRNLMKNLPSVSASQDLWRMNSQYSEPVSRRVWTEFFLIGLKSNL